MPTPFDNVALVGVGSCGCHQTVLSPYALPSGVAPTVLADFVNEVYLVEGEPVAVGDMFTSGSEWGNFDPADIQNGIGYAPAEGQEGTLVVTGDALALVLAEATVVLEFVNGENGAGIPSVDLHDDTFDTEYELSDVGGAGFGMRDYSTGIAYMDPAAAPDISAGPHKVAFTWRNGSMAGSLDGGAVVNLNNAEPWSPLPNACWIDIYWPGIIKSIGFYPAQDNADLSALAALD